MTTRSRQLQETLQWMVAAALMAQADVARADVQPAPLIDLPQQHRLLVTVGPFASHPRFGERAGRAVGGGVVARSLMLHRITTELRDSAGEPLPMIEGIRWEATLSITRQGLTAPLTLAQLGASAPGLVLPKLLGYRIDPGDAMNVHAVLIEAPSARGAIRLQVTIEYESLDGPVSRWAVVPAPLEISADSAGGCSWDWTSGVSGRFIAVAGLPLHGARTLELTNTATGAVLWRMSLPRHDAAAFSRPGDFVRLGVPVTQGETYRLTITYEGDAVQESAPGSVVQAMLLPGRDAVL
jgi:hypothetical protein